MLFEKLEKCFFTCLMFVWNGLTVEITGCGTEVPVFIEIRHWLSGNRNAVFSREKYTIRIARNLFCCFLCKT